ncbi:hypothetical protein [Christiangramia aquimixticola]|uniref:hypothetical protein n=1 Tax=Christiangramia aquimixticola TaxID=1697558 RepID=UPI003AA99E24
MKKISFLILLISNFAFSQEGFRFENDFKPNSEYLFKMNTQGITEVDFVGDSILLANFKNRGVELPIISKNESEVTVKTTTGKMDSQNRISAVIEYGDVINIALVNGEVIEQKRPISGTIAYGKYLENNKFQVDSLINPSKTQESLEMIKNMISELQQQIEFPDRKLHVGETFKNIIPFSIPIKGMNPVQISISTDYTLKEVKNEIAKFDLILSVELKGENEQLDLMVKGEGKGISEFNINDKITSNFSSDMTMNMTIKVNDQLTSKTKSTTVTNYKTEIRKDASR